MPANTQSATNGTGNNEKKVARGAATTANETKLKAAREPDCTPDGKKKNREELNQAFNTSENGRQVFPDSPGWRQR